MNQFIQFYLHRFGVPVLCALDKKHHQKRNNSCARVYYQLPCIAKAEYWPCDCPHHDDNHSEHKSDRSAAPTRREFGKPRKPRFGFCRSHAPAPVISKISVLDLHDVPTNCDPIQPSSLPPHMLSAKSREASDPAIPTDVRRRREGRISGGPWSKTPRSV